MVFYENGYGVRLTVNGAAGSFGVGDCGLAHGKTSKANSKAKAITAEDSSPKICVFCG